MKKTLFTLILLTVAASCGLHLRQSTPQAILGAPALSGPGIYAFDGAPSISEDGTPTQDLLFTWTFDYLCVDPQDPTGTLQIDEGICTTPQTLGTATLSAWDAASPDPNCGTALALSGTGLNPIVTTTPTGLACTVAYTIAIENPVTGATDGPTSGDYQDPIDVTVVDASGTPVTCTTGFTYPLNLDLSIAPYAGTNPTAVTDDANLISTIEALLGLTTGDVTINPCTIEITGYDPNNHPVDIPQGSNSSASYCPAFSTGNGEGANAGNAGASCRAIYENVLASTGAVPADGVFYIKPDGPAGTLMPFKIYCDMTTDGGGWTLVNKSEFTAAAPSIIEMTGDVALHALATTAGGTALDPAPWGDGVYGNIYTASTQVSSFTDPATPVGAVTNPGYGFQAQVLQTPISDFGTAENYAILDRNIIEMLRTNCYGGASPTARGMSVIAQRSSKGVRYIESTKLFNPIQHKCQTPTSTCNGLNTSGCHANFILGSEVFTAYDITLEQADPTTPLPIIDWTRACSSPDSSGTSPATQQNILPAGWAAGDPNGGAATGTAFYDLSFTDNATSGPVINEENNAFQSACFNFPGLCPLTTVWVK